MGAWGPGQVPVPPQRPLPALLKLPCKPGVRSPKMSSR